tara:strand:- start:64 stop:636 length:573 start_codon:yes stop_codon:yes gene_type:complete
MINYIKFLNIKSFVRNIFLLTLLIPLVPHKQAPVKAGLEFQWNQNRNYKKLSWYQKTSQKRARNKIFFFLKPNDRKTGFLTLNIKMPDKIKSSIKTKNISLCKVNIGGFSSKTKCLENIPSDVEINHETNKLNIYPINPIPSSKDSYAIVFKLANPQRTGLYQFHSFGKSSGPIPVSSYIGSWTIKIDEQ